MRLYLQGWFLLTAGFVQVMGNLQSHGILEFHFQGLESHEI